MIPVSICLTTYNRASVLPKTLDSLLAQTFGDFELIISDDCSSDNTEEVCWDYAAKDRRVKYFRNARNLKIPGNLNAAIRLATGLYIATVHDGDIYRHDLIEKWKNALDAVADAPFVFNAYDAVLPDGSHRLFMEPFELRMSGLYIARHHFRTLSSSVWGTVMARASAYAKAGPFDPTFGFISDVDMWLRLARDADVAYVPEPLMTITPHEPDHPYRYESWQLLFWQFGIYARHLQNYHHKLPHEVSCWARIYPQRLRKRLLWAMLSLIRHRQWVRVREGFGIWRDAHDPVLRRLGGVLGSRHWQPEWYNRDWWEMVRLPLKAA
jgi:glycosyltransferase involved in cell wall biosynthesis